MTAALVVWAVLSIPAALLLARIFRTSSLPADVAPGSEASSPAQPHATQVRAGEASKRPGE